MMKLDGAPNVLDCLRSLKVVGAVNETQDICALKKSAQLADFFLT